jgi:hypothetical protein
MPRIVKIDPETAGFYKRVGDTLLFAPTSVTFADETKMVASQFTEYLYPREGWTFYGSEKSACKAEGLPVPDPTKPQSETGSLGEPLTRKERELERIAFLDYANPRLAEKLRKEQDSQEGKPANPKRFQTFESEDGTRWRFDQPRNTDGTYLPDDPGTLYRESSLQWILVEN